MISHSHARKSIGLALAGLLALSSLAACSAGAKEEASADAAESAIVFEDQYGNEVKLDKPAERIATTIIPSPAIIAAVDGSYEKIVGINESSLKANKGGISGDIFGTAATEATTIADSSFVPDMETILSLNPDVIIQWGNQGDDIVEPLKDAGIPLVLLHYGTQEDLETWISIFGTILGKEDRAREIIDGMHAKADALASQIDELGVEPTRGIVLSYGEELSASTKKDYQAYYFDLAKGVQVSADVTTDGSVISKEDIIAWDPEVIMLSAFDESTPADVYGDSQLAEVSAVKNKRVYKTPLGVYRWQVPCAESPLMWNWVAAMLHPEEYTVDLRQMMKDEISYLYNYELSEEEIDHVLRMELNEDSAYYTELFGKEQG